jgi:galactan 5-O-arabinofuranosyltransferase
VFDVQWWNAWVLLLILTGITLLLSSLTRRWKTRLGLACFAWWGVVAVHILFNGTPFGFNAIWGDQMYRTTMILKFMAFTIPSDMYLKNLPPFYPPLYFWLLARYAELFSLEAWQMIKTGSALVFALGPFMLYWLWRKSATRLQAIIATVATFIVFQTHIQAAPHEFLSHALFVPWWAHYVFGAGKHRPGKRRWIVGGLIGGAIFMTYYYPFFVAAIALAGGSLYVLSARQRRQQHGKQLKSAWKVIAASAVVSAPYWLPLLISMLFYGVSPGQNRWFHSGYAHLHLPFTEVSLAGLLSLIGLVWIVRGRRRPVCRAILPFVAAMPVYLILGDLLGNLDMPVLHLKVKDIGAITLVSAAGLGAGTLMHILSRRGRWRLVLPLVLIAVSLPFFDKQSRVVFQRPVEVARRGRVPDRLVKLGHEPDKRGAVFLTADHTLPVYMPGYLFIPISEHVSHPAGRFAERVQFLKHLQYVEHPIVFAAALRYNLYSPVDFILPRWEGDRWNIRFSVSDYPRRFAAADLYFPARVLRDSSLFTPEKGGWLYKVANPRQIDANKPLILPETSTVDSLQHISTIAALRHQLTPTGQLMLSHYFPVDWSQWRLADVHEADYAHDETVTLKRVHTLPRGDSLLVAFEYRLSKKLSKDYRVFFHVYDQWGDDFLNYDFSPRTPISQWPVDTPVLCSRMIPRPEGGIQYHVGFFSQGQRLGSGYRGPYEPHD